nr:MAG TPA: hypothetical protein [Bacteriophage sp.]
MVTNCKSFPFGRTAVTKNTPTSILSKEHANEHFINGIETVLEYAEQLPTVDAEVVVRCKGCKYYDRGECYHPRHERHLQSICQEDDDFCSCGTKKEEM